MRKFRPDWGRRTRAIFLKISQVLYSGLPDKYQGGYTPASQKNNELNGYTLVSQTNSEVAIPTFAVTKINLDLDLDQD